MMELKVYIEIYGEQRRVGSITGNSYVDAVFQYEREYLNSSYAAPISISLPFMEDSFSTEKTRCFFESILPEGFSRKAVANWIKADEKDYLTILSVLGKECLGAIKIVENDGDETAHYEKLTLSQIKKLASEGATKSTQILMETHLSLAGASGKVGLYYGEDKNWYLPKGDAPSTHIVKQSHVRLNKIVLNEQLCMRAAKYVGIDVPESFIINSGNGKDEDVLFATERFDRKKNTQKKIERHAVPFRLHQEDFAQAMGIPSEYKYETEKTGYLKRMMELIRAYSSNPIEDQKKLFGRVVFNYLIGNTDAHIKNYALLYETDLKSVRLAPAYDIVSTLIYNTSSNMSFFIGDEVDINKISRNTFLDASNELGIGRRLVEKVFDETANRFETSLKMAADEVAESGFKDAKKMQKEILASGGYSKI